MSDSILGKLKKAIEESNLKVVQEILTKYPDKVNVHLEVGLYLYHR